MSTMKEIAQILISSQSSYANISGVFSGVLYVYQIKYEPISIIYTISARRNFFGGSEVHQGRACKGVFLKCYSEFRKAIFVFSNNRALLLLMEYSFVSWWPTDEFLEKN